MAERDELYSMAVWLVGYIFMAKGRLSVVLFITVAEGDSLCYSNVMISLQTSWQTSDQYHVIMNVIVVSL